MTADPEGAWPSPSSDEEAERAMAAMFEALREDDASIAQADWLGNPRFDALARDLMQYERRAAVTAIAGLLTVPAYQTACLRLEVLLHLAACHCRGRRRITKRALVRWVNEILGHLPVQRMEDPVEDVFVSNVVTGSGNCRLFEGIWEGNDVHLQLLLDVVYFAPGLRDNHLLRARLEGLLALSEAVATRAGVSRWDTTTERLPHAKILRRVPELSALQQRVTFTEDDLQRLRIPVGAIAPFVADRSVLRELPSRTVRQSPFIRQPLAAFGRDIVILLPAAISMAARHAILDAIAVSGNIPALQDALDRRQMDILFGVMGQLDLPHGFRAPVPIRPGAIRVPAVVAGDIFVPFDIDKIAHVVLISDDVADAQRSGVASAVELSSAAEQELGAYVAAGAAMIRGAGAAGMTLLIVGGIGRQMGFSLPWGDDGLPRGWPTVSFSLDDLVTFAAAEDASLLRLWKLAEHEEVARAAGISVVSPNGMLSLYAYWERQGFELVPGQMPVPQPHGQVLIQADFVYEMRVATRKLTDVHAAPAGTDGAQLRVRRLTERSFFAASSHRPIYAAEDLVLSGELAGVVEAPDLCVWIFARRPSAPAALDTVYRTWSALLTWLDRLFPALQRLVTERRVRSQEADTHVARTGPTQTVRRFRLVLENEAEWASTSVHASPRPPATPWVTVATASTDAVIHLPSGFQSLLNQPSNTGERVLLEAVALELAASLSHPGVDTTELHREDLRGEITEAVAICMRGPDAREMHVWQTSHPLDMIDAGDLASPRFVQPEDDALWQLGLGARLGVGPAGERGWDESRGPLVIEGAAASTQFLHRTVDHVWDGLRTRLRALHGPALVEMLTRNVEAIFKDRDHWRRTARALSALYVAEDVAAISMHRESERALTAMASRVVIEMAMCTAPVSDGREPSIADVDWLVAGVALLLAGAADADAIVGGLVRPSVRVDPNGRLHTEREELQSVISRYGHDTHADTFRAAVDAYDDLFADGPDASSPTTAAGPRSRRELSPVWDERFQGAYLAEYGIPFDRVLDAFAELIDLAGQHGRVVVTTRGMVTGRLRTHRGFSTSEIDALCSAITLEPRARWDEAPPGFMNRDWEPWRFRRRLSVSARPILLFGDADDAPCIYGAAQVGASLSYVADGIRLGWFPTEYFQSRAMRRYRGIITEERGRAFEYEVGALCGTAGWTTKVSLPMTAVGAADELALGDLDVIAWRAGDPVLWIIECKRLQPTRTISEIVERLKQFRGESNDLLAKHVRRTDWVRAHLATVRAALGLPSDITVVQPLLVTNTRMPMQYAAALPLPPGCVVSADELGPALGRIPA